MSNRRSKKYDTPVYAKIEPRTPNQKLLIDTINNNLITFALGEAGVGKTAISVACGIQHYFSKWVQKLVLTRPVVEVGQSIGFLPGSAEEKLHPYLIPLFDEMQNFVSNDNLPEYEILPLNFMRGRTLKNSFIVLDESQNATEEQLRMFITRFGEGSKMVISGDITQSDLPQRLQGALERMSLKLNGLDLVGVVKLGKEDIVRHSIVSQVLTRLQS